MKAYGEDLTVTLDREIDGRWIADIESMPGVMVYGETREDAIRAVRESAKRVLDDQHQMTAVGSSAE